MMIDDDILITSDVARVLDLTPAAVRRLEKLGQLRALRTARGMRLFCRDDVERFAARRREDRGAQR